MPQRALLGQLRRCWSTRPQVEREMCRCPRLYPLGAEMSGQKESDDVVVVVQGFPDAHEHQGVHPLAAVRRPSRQTCSSISEGGRWRTQAAQGGRARTGSPCRQPTWVEMHRLLPMLVLHQHRLDAAAAGQAVEVLDWCRRWPESSSVQNRSGWVQGSSAPASFWRSAAERLVISRPVQVTRFSCSQPKRAARPGWPAPPSWVIMGGQLRAR